MLREPAGKKWLHGHDKKAKLLYISSSFGARHPLFRVIAHPDVKKCIQKVKTNRKAQKTKRMKFQESPNRQTTRYTVLFRGVNDKAQDEDSNLAATPHLRRSMRMSFQAHFGGDPLNIGV